jgi:hypothetical protein
MKTIIIALLATVLFSTTSFAAGTMQYSSNREIGINFGESTVRFIAALGSAGGLSLETITQLVDNMLKESYYAGKDGRNLEPLVNAYITEFTKAYDAGIAKQQ